MGIALITNNILSDSGTAVAGLVPTSRTISTTAPLTGGGDLSADRTIAIPAATTSVNGYLTSADWTTFNNKASTAALANYLPLAGGTLSGALGGTSATFSDQLIASSTGGGTSAIFRNTGVQNSNGIELRGGTAGTTVNWKIEKDNTVNGAFQLTPSTSNGGTTYSTPVLTIASTGAATFSSSVSATRVSINSTSTSFTPLFLNAEGNYSASGNMTTGFAIANTTAGRALNMGVFESGAYAWIQAAYINNADTTFALALQPRGGNVGIGTTAPSFATGTGLAVFATSADARIALKNTASGDTSTDGFQIVLTTALEAVIENRENASLRFLTNATESMRITAAGNVLIGKTSGTSKFAVVGLPTSATGLASGDFYQLSGVVMVVP
jgi:hypothetical protein